MGGSMTTEYDVQFRHLTVRDLPERMRPREAMARVGAQHVPDDTLIAVLLRGGIKGVNVSELARGLLERYGSLTALAQAPVEELAGLAGMGPVKAQVLQAALELGRRLEAERVPNRAVVKTPQDVVQLVRSDSRRLETEVFWVVMLDSRNRAKAPPLEVTRGLLDASLVHPREVFRDAIRSATAAVIVAHNHPSGDTTPSPEDLRITRQLVKAGGVVDIPVLDHIIVAGPKGDGEPNWLSMREQGLVEFG